ncbi:MAG: DivIVA domain-containing protein [Desulfovibrio sp.]|jgi:cell division initiation protein|nr:DivIVA domain-containing protein [Desulfovibrio sp.]
MTVNRVDILNHTFSRTLRGYDPEEVDNYLQEIADTLTRLRDERVRLANLAARLEEQLKQYAERENTMRDTLLISRRMGEEMKNSAQKEAQLIIESAQNRAENLTNQANQRLARILDEISEARKLKAQFEFKVRSVIEGHLKLLELSRMEDVRLERAASALKRNAEAERPGGSRNASAGPES